MWHSLHAALEVKKALFVVHKNKNRRKTFTPINRIFCCSIIWHIIIKLVTQWCVKTSHSLTIQIIQINAICPPAGLVVLSHLKSYGPHDHIRQHKVASYEMCDFSKIITIQPHCFSLTLINKAGNKKRKPRKAKLAHKSYNSHQYTQWLFPTINKCVRCTVTWNVVQHVWCRSQWWETAGCFLHGGLL